MRGTALSSKAIVRLSLLTTIGALGITTPVHGSEALQPFNLETQFLFQQSESPDESDTLSLPSTDAIPIDPEKTQWAIANSSGLELTEFQSEPSNITDSEASTLVAPASAAERPSLSAQTTQNSQESQSPEASEEPASNSPTSAPSGSTVPTLPPVSTSASSTVRLEISPVDDPRVVADGRSTVTLQGRLLNEQGELLPINAIATLTASAGEFVGADQDRDRPGFQVVVQQGQFTAQLQSTLEAQKVRVRAAVDLEDGSNQLLEGPSSLTTPDSRPLSPGSSPLEAYTQIEFITNLRPSLVTGSVNLRIGPGGTDFYDSFRDFLDPELLDDGTRVDANAAVFAIGAVGEWLFTGAYNSQRSLNETCDGTNRL
ncbi:MAG TPA: hypothetical protein V6D04_12365, partial [Candidatus Obscuribacterales bacterium]